MVRSFFDENGNRLIFGSGKDPLEKLSAPQMREIASYFVNRWDVLRDVSARAGQKHTPFDYSNAMSELAALLKEHGRRFMSAAKSGDTTILLELLEQGFPVNAREPATSFTALHHTAAHSSEDAVNALVERDDIDLLKRDGFGRLASELAGRFGENLELSRRLRMLEAAQAREQGITLTYRPRPPATED